jgi:hypothetical protein
MTQKEAMEGIRKGVDWLAPVMVAVARNGELMSKSDLLGQFTGLMATVIGEIPAPHWDLIMEALETEKMEFHAAFFQELRDQAISVKAQVYEARGSASKLRVVPKGKGGGE